MQIYVLSNCDKCRAALKWLRGEGIDFKSRDIRKDGIDANVISAAIGSLGWHAVLNRRSTSWRELGKAERKDIDEAKALKLIVANSTLMKRPLFVLDETYLTGFDDNVKQAILG